MYVWYASSCMLCLQVCLSSGLFYRCHVMWCLLCWCHVCTTAHGLKKTLKKPTHTPPHPPHQYQYTNMHAHTFIHTGREVRRREENSHRPTHQYVLIHTHNSNPLTQTAPAHSHTHTGREVRRGGPHVCERGRHLALLPQQPRRPQGTVLWF